MCSARVDPVIVLETLAQGADGVMVMGCHIGDCHYITGNLQAERRINMLKKLLARTGLEVKRFRLEWVSASEGGRFADLVKDFVNQSEEELDKILNEVIDTEFVRNRIYLWVKEDPLSVKELSKRLDMDSKTVLRHIVVMRRRGLITVDRVEGISPLYTALEVGK